MGESRDQTNGEETRSSEMKLHRTLSSLMGLLITATSKAVGSVTTAGLAVSAGILFLLMFYITADVCGRYFFRAPLKGSLEVSELMQLAIILLGTAYTHRKQGHVRIELFINRLSFRKQVVVGLVYSLIGIGFMALLIQDGMRRFIIDLHSGLTTDQLRAPIFPFRLLIPIGAAMLVLELLVDFSRQLRELVK